MPSSSGCGVSSMVALAPSGPSEARLHLGVGHGLVLLVANLHAHGHAGVVGQHLFGRGRRSPGRACRSPGSATTAARRSAWVLSVWSSHIFQRQLPAVANSSGAAAAVILGHQQRLWRLPCRRGYQQRGGAGLGFADFLIIGQLRHLLPAVQVAGRVVIQAGRCMLCAPCGVSSSPVKSRWNVPLPARQLAWASGRPAASSDSRRRKA